MLLIGRGLIQRKKVCADELIFVSNVFGFEGIKTQGPVAQLVRAPPCHGGGRRFESDLGRLFYRCMINIWGLSSAGRASALQAEGHRFEPYRPHSFYKCQ